LNGSNNNETDLNGDPFHLNEYQIYMNQVKIYLNELKNPLDHESLILRKKLNVVK